MNSLNRELRLVFVVLILTIFSGCATQEDIYYWGNYENLVYGMYAEPGSADPLAQVEQLTADIEEAANNGKPVPPGVYAHLGMMYAHLGEMDAAMAALNTEKELYPESTILVDGMISRATTQEES